MVDKTIYFDPRIAIEQLDKEELREQKKKKRKTLVQAFKYLCFTASAGLIEFVTYTIFMKALPIDENATVWFITQNNMLWFVSTAISLFLSIVWNFTLNRKFTFKSAGNVPRAMFLAFLFYVPFFPFKLWFNSYMPGYLGVDPFLIEVITLLINGVLEFCWQKFVIYRKEADTAPQKHDIGTIGEFGEISVQEEPYTASQLLDLMRGGADVASMSDKEIAKAVKAAEKAA